jgi:hypothetical protein
MVALPQRAEPEEESVVGRFNPYSEPYGCFDVVPMRSTNEEYKKSRV